MSRLIAGAAAAPAPTRCKSLAPAGTAIARVDEEVAA
jgi:hypothetical protein